MQRIDMKIKVVQKQFTSIAIAAHPLHPEVLRKKL
jgi:hypothetical protein